MFEGLEIGRDSLEIPTFVLKRISKMLAFGSIKVAQTFGRAKSQND